MNIGTSYGLALASGIDAYIPLLSYAICARFFHLFKVNSNLAFITQDWFMITLVILELADLFADKIPVVDHVWDAIHTVIRPVAGAIVAAAASNQTSGAALLLPIIFGGTLAGMAHTTKVATRLASTASTAGIANIGISLAEDVTVVIATLLSLFVPIVMVVVIVLFVIIFLVVVPRLFRVLGRGLQRLRGRSSRSGAA